MNILRPNQIIIVIVGIVIIGIGVFSYLSSQENKEEQASQNGEARESSNILGKVTSVNSDKNSFVLFHSGQDKEYTIQLSEDTEMIRIVFPFDPGNPTSDITLIPEREMITIESLEENDQVFVRSDSPIKSGQGKIINPLQVQILP